MERVIAFSIEHVLVGNALQLHRNFGVPAAFHLAFHMRSSNAFPVRLLLSGTVLSQQLENFSDICKVLFQFAFHNMIVPLYTSSSACMLKLPSISHTSFLMLKPFTKSSPFSQLLSPNLASFISSRHAVFVWRLGDLLSAKKKLNRGRGL